MPITPDYGWSWMPSWRWLSAAGALIIQGMNTGILLSGFQPELNQVVKAVVVLCVLVVQSQRFISLIKGVRGHDKT